MPRGVSPALRDVANVGSEELDNFNALTVRMAGSKASMDNASNAIQSVRLVLLHLNFVIHAVLLIS